MSGILAKIKHRETCGVLLGIYLISEMSSLEKMLLCKVFVFQFTLRASQCY